MTIKDSIQFSVGKHIHAVHAELDAWQKDNKVERLWSGDASLWTNLEENKWMGWLNIAAENTELPKIRALAKEIRSEDLTHIVLLGMGGSSLAPAMMAKIFGKISDYPQLHVLDSTDPLQIRHLEDKIDLKKTCFIVSSKSGSTLEPNIFKDYFYSRMQTVLNKTVVGERFIAITDPGTPLEKMAKNNDFRAIFYGVPSIGGRYSALSNFGMVPAGLMGIDVKELLHKAQAMQKACSPGVLVKDNPGVILGVILGVCARFGQDKITFIISPKINALGSWLEQLLAESTGKKGKGLIPIDQEPLGLPEVYGHDRLFIYIRLQTAPDSEQDRIVYQFEQSGFIVVKLQVKDLMHLGAELFRWEIATNVVGSILGIDPFNQPDVEESKKNSLQLTNKYEKTGHIDQPTPFFSEHGLSLYTDDKNMNDITQYLRGKPGIVNYIRAHFDRIKPNDYVDLCAFIEMSEINTLLLQDSRVLIRDYKHVATCLGFGPRFLHSTGQDYKGGPNTGVFLQITCDFTEDIKVPGHHYSFGLVITAQAQADFTVLGQCSRRILRIHLGKDVQAGLQELRIIIDSALGKSSDDEHTKMD